MWYTQHPLSSDRPVLTDFSVSKPERAASAYVTTSIRMADGRVAGTQNSLRIADSGRRKARLPLPRSRSSWCANVIGAQSIISASDKSHPGTSTASFGPFGAASLRSYRVHGRAGSNSSGRDGTWE